MTATSLALLVEQASVYASQARSDATCLAYGKAWRAFAAWCGQQGLPSLPATPATVAVYLSSLADGHKVSTIALALTAISQVHKRAGLPTPRDGMTVRDTMRGIRRKLGTRQEGKAPLLADALRTTVQALPTTPLGVRDRALLLLGFAGAFRRSELASLNVQDLRFQREGLTVALRRSKTDQEGQGRSVAIPYGASPSTCPVRAVQSWLEVRGAHPGRLLLALDAGSSTRSLGLSDHTVAVIVKRRAKEAGIPAKELSGHSLRAGLATSAALAGKSERAIMRQTGHTSVVMVRRYIRDADLFRDNASTGLL